MTRTMARPLLCILGALWLGACGGGGAGGGGGAAPAVPAATPIVTSGPITGFGSIFVNGTKYELINADIEVDDRSGTEDDLRLGMIVTVEGLVDANGVATAERVVYKKDLEGPIETIDRDGQRLTILGQTVLADGLTVIEASGQEGALQFTDLLIGAVVEVSGQINADGAVLAARIEVQAAGFVPGTTDVELKGTLSLLDTTASTFTIGSLVVDFSTATVEGVLSNGAFVEVHGTQMALGEVLQARRVEVQTPGVDAAVGAQVEIEGLVSSVTSATTFVIRHQEVRHTARTVFDNGSVADIAIHAKLEVEGSLDVQGILVAEKISFRPPGGGRIRIAAVVEAVDPTTGTVTLVGVRVQVTNLTQLKDNRDGIHEFALTDLRVGDWVDMRGSLDAAGIVVASKLERDDPDDVVLQAPVDSVNAPLLTLLGVTVQTNADTEFEDLNDTGLTASQFFNQVQTGNLIKAKGMLLNDGTLLAHEIAFEGEDG